ncbi:MAG: hypothetical protein KGJ01_02440 [Patescibacteria group bacterium]|nr:hypothetical protein [Patescibacteria group bacterium]
MQKVMSLFGLLPIIRPHYSPHLSITIELGLAGEPVRFGARAASELLAVSRGHASKIVLEAVEFGFLAVLESSRGSLPALLEPVMDPRRWDPSVFRTSKEDAIARAFFAESSIFGLNSLLPPHLAASSRGGVTAASKYDTKTSHDSRGSLSPPHLDAAPKAGNSKKCGANDEGISHLDAAQKAPKNQADNYKRDKSLSSETREKIEIIRGKTGVGIWGGPLSELEAIEITPEALKSAPISPGMGPYEIIDHIRGHASSRPKSVSVEKAREMLSVAEVILKDDPDNPTFLDNRAQALAILKGDSNE